MIFLHLTNGFGNNLFQYIAARLLAEKHNKKLIVIPPSKTYYGTDELKKINGSKILVINCLQIKEHLSHLNLKEMLNLVSNIDVGKVYLTHISQNLGLHDEVNKKLPKNIELAYDNLELSL